MTFEVGPRWDPIQDHETHRGDHEKRLEEDHDTLDPPPRVVLHRNDVGERVHGSFDERTVPNLGCTIAVRLQPAKHAMVWRSTTW